MSKQLPSPDSIPLPFYGETTSAVEPSDDRLQHVASFMLDKTEPVHAFTDQISNSEVNEKPLHQRINSGLTYDVVQDPEASEAAHDQGWGNMPVFRKPNNAKTTKKQTKSQHKIYEHRRTGAGQEPPIFDPITAVYPEVTENAEISEGHQEFRDLAEGIEIQDIMNTHNVSLEAARNIRAAKIERNKKH